MSDSPPPFDEPKQQQHHQSDDTEEHTRNTELDNEMFFSSIGDSESKTDSKQALNEDMDDIFSQHTPKEISASLDATNEIKLNDDEDENPFSFEAESKAAAAAVTTPRAAEQPVINILPPKISLPPPPVSNINPVASFSSQISASNNNNVSSYKKAQASFDEDDEERDQFIEIKLSDAVKVGDGMSSYMSYKVSTKTNWPSFKQKEVTTSRRFSDFFSLYERLKQKHQQHGRFLPPEPEKDMFGTTKVKMTKENEGGPNDFLEKRKCALERFLSRVAQHKTLRDDPDFRDFLTTQDLPKAPSTSTISAAGMMKFLKIATDTVSKIAVKMEETDPWFDEKAAEVDNLLTQLRKLHSSTETICGWRKDLAYSTKEYAKSMSILANSEEHINLSRALSQLAEIHEKLEQIQIDQVHSDFFVLTELAKDYIGLLENIKEAFHQRVRVFTNWHRDKDTLKTKQDNKLKLEAANKQDKIPTALAEIKEWEEKVDKGKNEFELISTTIKEEMKKFDASRIKEFKKNLTKYLETLLDHQETIQKIWEQYLADVKAI